MLILIVPASSILTETNWRVEGLRSTWWWNRFKFSPICHCKNSYSFHSRFLASFGKRQALSDSYLVWKCSAQSFQCCGSFQRRVSYRSTFTYDVTLSLNCDPQMWLRSSKRAWPPRRKTALRVHPKGYIVSLSLPPWYMDVSPKFCGKQRRGEQRFF